MSKNPAKQHRNPEQEERKHDEDVKVRRHERQELRSVKPKEVLDFLNSL